MLKEKYWKQVIIDYLDCSDDFYKDVDIDLVAEKVMDDEEMWNTIYDTVEYYLKNEYWSKNG